MLGFHKTGQAERGDTLIEVLFAITVFSLVVVTTLSIMNQGMQISLRSLQLTYVRQQVDAQAETLRFLSSSYVAAYTPGMTAATATGPAKVYATIVANAITDGPSDSSAFGAQGAVSCPVPETGSFILNTRKATLGTLSQITDADTVAEVRYDAVTNNIQSSRGIWIEPVRAREAGSSVGYTDFHVRACWPAPGLSTPMSTGTIVRLYEPRT
jgi:hypothetical protein